MTAVIVVASVAVYLAGLILTARWWYAHIRPWTEPLACRKYTGCRQGEHDKACYRRYGMVDTTMTAVSAAWGVGLIWCLFLIGAAVMGAGRVVVASGVRETPEEMAAKVTRLEEENDRLRRGR